MAMRVVHALERAAVELNDAHGTPRDACLICKRFVPGEPVRDPGEHVATRFARCPFEVGAQAVAGERGDEKRPGSVNETLAERLAEKREPARRDFGMHEQEEASDRLLELEEVVRDRAVGARERRRQLVERRVLNADRELPASVDLFERAAEFQLVELQHAVRVAHGEHLPLVCVDNAKIARERARRPSDDAVQRLGEGSGRSEKQIAQRVQNFELIRELLRGSDLAERVARQRREIQQFLIGRLGTTVLPRTKDREDVLAHIDHGDRARVVRTENMPRLVLGATRDAPGLERDGEKLLVRETHLDDAGPALTAADPTDVRKARVADLPEQEKVGRARGRDDALDRRHSCSIDRRPRFL